MFGFRRQVVTTNPPVAKPVEVYNQPQPVVVDNAGQYVSTRPVYNSTVAAPVAASPVYETTVPVATETAYVNSRWDNFRLAVSNRIQAIFGFVFSVVAILIISRFVLLATGASLAGEFASFIMGWSQPLIHPFVNLFNNPVLPSFHLFEVADVVALIVYGIVTSLVCYLIALLLSPSLPSRRVVVTR